MAQIELTEIFLADIAGWTVVKEARSLLKSGKVLSANWTSSVLKGVVQEGSTSYRSGLVINNRKDIENLCQCRKSRQWGTICAHSVAVGLRQIQRDAQDAEAAGTSKSTQSRESARSGDKRQRPATSATKSRLTRAEDTQGERLEIAVIFPPNLEQALAKGKVMLYFEGLTASKRTPLNQVSRSTPFVLESADTQLLDCIEPIADGEPPGMLMAGPDDLCRILTALAGHPRVRLGKSQEVTIDRSPWVPPLKATLQADGQITLASKTDKAPAMIVGKDQAWSYSESTFRPLELAHHLSRVITEGSFTIPRRQVPQFLNQDWPQLQSYNQVEANFRPEDFTLTVQPPRFLLHLTGGLAQLQAQLQCAYGQRILSLGVSSSEEVLWLPDPDDPTRYSTRDHQSERAALNRLRQNGFSGPDAQGNFQLIGQENVFNFLATEYPKLVKEWEITMEERLEKSTAKNVERIEPDFQVVSSGERWFDLDVAYKTSSGERLSQNDIQKLLLSGRNYTRLKDGKVALIDTGAVEELQETLQDCSPEQHARGYRISNAQAGFLESTLREQGGWEIQAPQAWRDGVARQQGTTDLSPPPLGDLEDVLRPYQKSGVGWLHFLRQNGFGGILADEMGLGKTLQTLAFFKFLRDQGASKSRPPFLIVCPTSLVFNWLAEAKRFTPELRAMAIHGPKRQPLFKRIPENDLIITSYALIRRDAKRYKELEFDTVVLDEAQHIKNRQTQNAQAVKAIRSHYRLVLTGTPLENSVSDLWSIFDFLMPGYLGSAKDFRERYELPIVKEKDQQVQARLAKRLRPFLLRRTKPEVASDLPEKIDQVAYCELTKEQGDLYKEILEASRRKVFETVEQQGVAKSRMVVLNALLRLRQICCDLRLLKLEETQTNHPSGKLELFNELFQEILDGSHRVLVFSQFVEMLKLLRAKLDEDEIPYCYLDGSTTDRGSVVGKFQNDPEIPIFLISLKAGGVGLNLSGADTVIHFDPWWNPAVEDQATDRAHRIGQTQVVTNYKLITRNTVEEKILNLQNRKRDVIQGTLGEENQLVDNLSWDDIQELFSD